MIVLGIYFKKVTGAYEARRGRVYSKGKKKHLTLYAIDDQGKFFTRIVSRTEGLIWRLKKRRQKKISTS